MDENQTAAEYPKMVYQGGQPYTEEGRGVPHHQTRTVNSAEEEAEAEAEGFTAVQPAPVEEDPAEVIPEDKAE